MYNLCHFLVFIYTYIAFFNLTTSTAMLAHFTAVSPEIISISTCIITSTYYLYYLYILPLLPLFYSSLTFQTLYPVIHVSK